MLKGRRKGTYGKENGRRWEDNETNRRETRINCSKLGLEVAGFDFTHL